MAAGPSAGDVVLEAMGRDPRWDRQIDARADYYARLVHALGIPVLAVGELLRTHAERTAPEDLGRDPVALDVLARLVDFGDSEAVEVLRQEARYGEYRVSAIEGLVDDIDGDPSPGWQGRTEGLAEALISAHPEPAELRRLLDWRLLYQREPWNTWAKQFPSIEAAADLINAAVAQQARPTPLPVADLTTAQLLGHERAGDLRLIAVELAGRTATEDTEAMLATVADPAAPMCGAAARALAEQGNVAVLPALLGLRAGLRPPILSNAFRKALIALPYPATRETAHAWLTSDADDVRRATAARIFAEHSSPDDVDVIRPMLDRELDAGLSGDLYIVSNLAEALGRHPDAGPFPELERAFREMAYSYGRHFVADAIAETDPEFGRHLALDALWDAEASIRALAAECVCLDIPGAVDRLRELAEDRFEDARVRTAAAAGLDEAAGAAD